MMYNVMHIIVKNVEKWSPLRFGRGVLLHGTATTTTLLMTQAGKMIARVKLAVQDPLLPQPMPHHVAPAMRQGRRHGATMIQEIIILWLYIYPAIHICIYIYI